MAAGMHGIDRGLLAGTAIGDAPADQAHDFRPGIENRAATQRQGEQCPSPYGMPEPSAAAVRWRTRQSWRNVQTQFNPDQPILDPGALSA